ncbi:MAG: hypothetical protein AB7J13_16145 [Pyrinomonadaceae bacterium]
MPKTPKDKPASDQKKCDEPVADGRWEADIENRGYYYDDAHGYEKYDPAEEEPSEEADGSK